MKFLGCNVEIREACGSIGCLGLCSEVPRDPIGTSLQRNLRSVAEKSVETVETIGMHRFPFGSCGHRKNR